MNGLRYIRIQCNLSLNNLAEQLNVSRQLISQWENGKKSISAKRKQQLAKFFGLDEEFFGEITEEQKEILLSKAMFRYTDSEGESYRYKPQNENESSPMYFFPEQEQSLDEAYISLKKVQRELEQKISSTISGPSQKSIQDQMAYIKRGTMLFAEAESALESCYHKEIPYKMFYYHRMLEIMMAMNLALGEPQDESRQAEIPSSVNLTHVQNLAENFRTYIEEQRKPLDKIIEGRKQSKNKPSAAQKLSVQERIAKAEQEYRDMDKPDGMTGASVRG